MDFKLRLMLLRSLARGRAGVARSSRVVPAALVLGLCLAGFNGWLGAPGLLNLLDDGTTVAGFDTKPIRAVGPTASTPSTPTSSALSDLVAGGIVWSGMTAVEPTRGTTRITKARALTSNGLQDAIVYVGRLGIDGATGVTRDRQPGFGESGVTGAPRRAVGAVLEAHSDWVVYVTGSVSPSKVNGYILGARLTVEDEDGEHDVLVMSPTQLCSDAVPPDPTHAEVGDLLPPPCKAFRRQFIAAIRDTFDVEL